MPINPVQVQDVPSKKKKKGQADTNPIAPVPAQAQPFAGNQNAAQREILGQVERAGKAGEIDQLSAPQSPQDVAQGLADYYQKHPTAVQRDFHGMTADEINKKFTSEAENKQRTDYISQFGPAQGLEKQYQGQLSQDFANQIVFDRAGVYAMKHAQTWAQHPEAWSGLINSGVSEESHNTLAKFGPGLIDWAENKYTFGGVKGFLLPFVTIALNIPDRAERAAALGYLSGLASESEAQQQMWISEFQARTGMTDPTQIAQAMNLPGIAMQVAWPGVKGLNPGDVMHHVRSAPNPQGAGNTLDTGLIGTPGLGGPTDQGAQYTGNITYDGRLWNNKDSKFYTDPSLKTPERQQQTLKLLEEASAQGDQTATQELGLDFQNKAPTNQVYDSGPYATDPSLPMETRIEYTQKLLQQAAGNGDKEAAAQLGYYDFYQPDAKARLTDNAREAYKVAFITTFAALTGGVGAGLEGGIAPLVSAGALTAPFLGPEIGATSRVIEKSMKNSHGILGVLGDIQHYTNNIDGMVARFVLRRATWATGKLEVANNFAYRHATGHNMNPDINTGLSQIQLAIILHGIKVGGTALHTSVTTPAPVAASELGVGEGLLDSYDQYAKLHPSPLARVIHPFKSLFDPALNYGFYKVGQYVHNTSWEALLGRWQESGAFFDEVERIQNNTELKSPEAVSQFIQTRYSQPKQLADLLANTPRKDMPLAVEGYIRNMGGASYRSSLASANSAASHIAANDEAQVNAETEVSNRQRAIAATKVLQSEIDQPGVQIADPVGRMKSILQREGLGGALSDDQLQAMLPQQYGSMTTMAGDQAAELQTLTEGLTPESLKANDYVVHIPVDMLQQYLEDRGALTADENELRTRANIVKAKYTQSEFDALVADIKKNGVKEPLTLSTIKGPGPSADETYGSGATGHLTDGTHRFLAAKEAGLDTVPVRVSGALDTENLTNWVKNKFPDAPGVTGMEPGDALAQMGGTEGRTADQFQAIADHRSMLENGVEVWSKELDDLRLEGDSWKAHYDARMAKAAEQFHQQEPILNLPKGHSLPEFLHRVFYAPMGGTEEAFRTILNPMARVRGAIRFAYEQLGDNYTSSRIREKQPWLTKLTDKMEAAPKITYVDSGMNASRRYVVEDITRRNLERTLMRIGASPEEMANIIGDIMGAGSQDEWYQSIAGGRVGADGAKMDSLFGVGGIIDRHLPKNMSPEMRDNVLSIAKNTQNDQYAFHTTEQMGPGVSVAQPVMPGEKLPDNTYRQLPAMPSMELHNVTIPVAALDDALRLNTRYAGLLSDAGTIPGSMLAKGLEAIRMFMHVTTNIGKPLLLVSNIPAIILVKTLDEMMGNAAMPGFNQSLGRRGLDMMVPPDVIGQSIHDTYSNGQFGADTRFNVTPSSNLVVNGTLREGAAQSLTSNLINLSSDPLVRRFAAEGLDTAEMLRVMTDPTYAGYDEELGSWFKNQMEPRLGRSAENGWRVTTPEEWLGRLKSMVEDTTFGGNADYIRFVAHGHIPDNGILLGRLSHEQSFQATTLTNELSGITGEMDKLDRTNAADYDTLVNLEHQYRRKLNDLNALTGDVLEPKDVQFTFDGGKLRKGSSGLAEHDKLATRISEDYKGGRINLPDLVTEDRLAYRRPAGLSALDTTRRFVTDMSAITYNRGGFRLIGKAESRLGKGSFYSQRAEVWKKTFTDQGFTENQATEMAAMHAADETRDFFYDITTRSTTERGIKNLFWFAPVEGELMYRWLYKIPAESGWFFGAPMLALQAANYYNLLSTFHIIHTDPATGAASVPAGVVKLLSKLDPKVSFEGENLNIPLASINPHLPLVGDQLMPSPNATVSAIMDHIPALKNISQALAPYTNYTFIPSGIRNAAAAFGIKLPDISNDVVNQQWDHTHDIAIRYAYTNLEQQGVTPPALSDFHLVDGDPDYAAPGTTQYQTNVDNYNKAYAIYATKLNAESQKLASGLYLMKSLSSVALPGYISVTNDQQTAYIDWYAKNVAPQIAADGWSPDVQKLIDAYVLNHPDSMAFSVTMGQYTGKPIPPTADPGSSDYMQKVYGSGAREYMDPADYAQMIGLEQSRLLYQNRQQLTIDSLASQGGAPAVLRNYGTKTVASDQTKSAYDAYIRIHGLQPTLDRFHSQMEQTFGISPGDTSGISVVTDTLSGLKELAPLFLGEGGVPNTDYKRVTGVLKAQIADYYAKHPYNDTTQDPVQQGIFWYMKNVAAPYYDATGPLWDQWNKARAAGHTADAQKIMDKIDTYRASADAVASKGFKGQAYPGMDEFMYGSQPPPVQKQLTLKWLTQPVEWLSPWQRSHVGYAPVPHEDRMWKEAAKINAKADAAQNGLSGNSSSYKAWEAWRQNNLLALGKTYGPEGERAMVINQAPPFARLWETGYGGEYMKKVYGLANTVISHEISAGEPFGSTAKDAVAGKMWFIDQIVGFENDGTPQGARLKHDMRQLGLALGPQENNQLSPTGWELWDRIFFDNWSPYHDPDLINRTPLGAV